MRLADREMRDSSRQVHYRFISCCGIGMDWHGLALFPQPEFVALGSNAMLLNFGKIEAWPDKGTLHPPALTGTHRMQNDGSRVHGPLTQFISLNKGLSMPPTMSLCIPVILPSAKPYIPPPLLFPAVVYICSQLPTRATTLSS